MLEYFCENHSKLVGVAAIICAFTATTLRFNPGSFPDYTLALPIKLFLRFLASFVGVFGFSVVFNSTPKMAAIAGIMGAIANFGRLLLTDIGISPSFAAFAGALLVGVLASSIKQFIGFPRITITVPSIVIMVPGMFMYKGIHFLSSGDFSQGGSWLCRAFVIVISLPLGLVIARIMTDRNFAKSS